jgi:hypothetical protein
MDFVQNLLKTCRELGCLCGLILMSNMLGGMQHLNAETSVEVHLMRFILLVPSVNVFPQENPQLAPDRQQINFPLLNGRHRIFNFQTRLMCLKQPGTYDMEVLDFRVQEKRQQIDRFTCMTTPEYKRWCLKRGLCFLQNCACQKLQRPGLDLHSNKGMYYDCREGTWQPEIGSTHPKILRWYRQLCSDRIVSNWFRVVLHTDDVERTDYYTLNVPVSVLCSYAHQFKGFQDLEAQFRSEQSIAVPSYQSDQTVGLCSRTFSRNGTVFTAQKQTTLEDIWLCEDIDGLVQEK